MDNAMFSGSEIPSKLGLLLVDDEEFNLKALKRILRDQGFEIFCATSGEIAIQVMEEEDVAIIVSDMRMPSMSGDELLIKIGERWPDTLKIILTGYTDITNTLNVLNSSSIFRYLSKPWDDEFLLSTIHEAAAIYWGKVMDFYFEQSTKEQNEKLQSSNLRLRESIDQSQYQLKKINDKLKSAYEGEKRLRREREEAEKENVAKSQFLATMSHEIRTPLNSIIATSSLLLESDLSDEQKELVSLSLNGGNTLLSIINDVLDFSKINAGKLNLQEEWFNLINLVDETCELLSGQVVNKTVDIVSVIQPKTPLEVYGDPTRIRQIITNLISNALKFTEDGCIEVEVSYDTDLCFSIRDSGIGMAERDIQHIFDEFTQVDSGNTRAKGGTGLGLSICRQLTHLMHGRINASSELHKGSTFSVNLPLPSRNPIAYPIFDGAERNLLLVSTNQHLHKALSTQLLCFNCKVHQKEHLPDQSAYKFDAILYDVDSICIPAEHFANADRIKTTKAIDVALISNDGISRSKDIKKLGFDIVLRKPFRISSIVRCLIYNIDPQPTDRDLTTEQRQIIRQWSMSSADQPNHPKVYSLNASILLAEDSPSNQAVIKSVLKNMDVEVDIVNNGEEAVECSKVKKYDIILMDMSMPLMDGITAAKSIIEEKTINAQTPIIALTANAYTEDKESCMEAGMVDFLQKPIDIDLFRSKISEWCRPKVDRTRSSPSKLPYREELNTNAPNTILIDTRVYKQLERDTSKEVLPDIVDIFLEETQERLSLMQDHCKNQNWPALSREAHTLKSSAGSFGAVALSNLARNIEDSIKSNDTKQLQRLHTHLTPLVVATFGALNDLKVNGA